MEKKFQLIIALINYGFADLAMNAARDVGARGGTILRARGTGNAEMEKKYGIAITPNKEMIMILVDSTQTDDVMKAIYKSAGLGTKGQGICFAIPVDDVVGFKF